MTANDLPHRVAIVGCGRLGQQYAQAYSTSGGGCQHISVLRLLADAEVEEVIAWGTPAAALAGDTDEGLIVHGRFRLAGGLDCPVFGLETPYKGVEVWSDEALIRWSEFGYLTSSIRSLLAAVETGSELWISGHDPRQALEVAIAAKVSAERGSVPIRLPLEDRSLRLYPRRYRWLGGDAAGRPQSVAEAAGRGAPSP